MEQKNDGVIRVTADDIAAVQTPEPFVPVTAPSSQPSGARSYGNINTAAAEAAPVAPAERPSFLLQGWFYLGAAGLLGAVAAWGICEPAFVDEYNTYRWGNIWMMPLVTAMMLTGFALAESIVERSLKKALKRLLVIPLGIIMGFIFEGIANVVYGAGLQLVVATAGESTIPSNPAWWIAGALAWAVFGVAGGLIYGLIGQSGKKAKYGVLGGALGAFLGGLVFDPIALLVDHGIASRAVGFGLLGTAAGAAMGFVESALKDRWLYVSAGPLAGKQFVLYKASTSIGSDQSCDIYLFKDNSILPQHAMLEVRGAQASLRAQAPVYVSGVPTQNKVLLSGDTINVGRYSFKYNERHR